MKRRDYGYAICPGCQKLKKLFTLRICKACHTDKNIRVRFPSPGNYGVKSDVIPDTPEGFPVRIPAEATLAFSKTEERILVMRERARKQESLFHPSDNNCLEPGTQPDVRPPRQEKRVFTCHAENSDGYIGGPW